jgi:hypothetical protein
MMRYDEARERCASAATQSIGGAQRVAAGRHFVAIGVRNQVVSVFYMRKTMLLLTRAALLVLAGAGLLIAAARARPMGAERARLIVPQENTQASTQASASLSIPSGTAIAVRMIDPVDSSKNKVGDEFHASLDQPLVSGNTVVAPKGADVTGRLAEAKSAGHIAGKAELKLELTAVRINGTMQPLVTGNYEVAGKSRGNQSAKRIGGGAVLGAVIGAIAGGGKGAAIGAGVGAGVGTAAQVITHGEQVKIPSETVLDFTLEQTLMVTPAQTPQPTGAPQTVSGPPLAAAVFSW